MHTVGTLQESIFSTTVHPADFTLGGCIMRIQGSAVLSVKSFGWVVLEKAASNNTRAVASMSRRVMNGHCTTLSNNCCCLHSIQCLKALPLLLCLTTHQVSLLHHLTNHIARSSLLSGFHWGKWIQIWPSEEFTHVGLLLTFIGLKVVLHSATYIPWRFYKGILRFFFFRWNTISYICLFINMRIKQTMLWQTETFSKMPSLLHVKPKE